MMCLGFQKMFDGTQMRFNFPDVEDGLTRVLTRVFILLMISVTILYVVSFSFMSVGGIRLRDSVAPFELPPDLDPASCPTSFKEQKPLVLVSLDGFRAEYLTRKQTPTIDALGRAGVTAPYMKPSFPTMTFPNHYTIATGLYPSAHGIIANDIFDPEFAAVFKRGEPESFKRRWWGGEPIWRTAERQGKKAATFFWPGTEVKGLHPSVWYSYNKTVPFERRVDTVLSWLDLPKEKRPDFITLYMHEPDHSGHRFGPYSPEVEEALIQVDNMVRRLVTGIQERGLLACVNILVLSDHGMAEGGQEKVIRADKYVDGFMNKVSHFWDGVFPRYSSKDDNTETELNLTKSLACVVPEMRVYNKEHLPVRWHLGAQRRLEDVVLDLDPGYTVAAEDSFKGRPGAHGYDYLSPDMNALFLAFGPSFRRNAEVEVFQNIELYNLMCHLVGVSPAPNNGTWGALHHMLAHPPPLPPPATPGPLPVTATLPSGKDKGQKKRMRVAECEGDEEVLQDESFKEKWLSTLDEGTKDLSKLTAQHLPWGAPSLASLGQSLRLLPHPDHLTVYSGLVKLPLWTSFTVNGRNSTPQSHSWVSDPRLSSDLTPKCTSYFNILPFNVTRHPLFPPELSTCEGCDRLPFLVSNALPFTTQLAGRWSGLVGLVRWWGKQFGIINVVSGPVFDYDGDSFADDLASVSASGGLVIPTHMFLVATRCLKWVDSLNECPAEQLDALAFVFPQYHPVANCMEPARYARMFSAKVDDVEKITGLTFFSKLKPEAQIKLRVRLHSDVWGFESWWNRLRSDSMKKIGS